MKKAILLLIVLTVATFCIAGCGKTITGEMITEGKVMAFSERELRQERSDGKGQYISDITNISSNHSKISESMNNGTSVKIFWRTEKDTASGFIKNTIVRIE